MKVLKSECRESAPCDDYDDKGAFAGPGCGTSDIAKVNTSSKQSRPVQMPFRNRARRAGRAAADSRHLHGTWAFIW